MKLQDAVITPQSTRVLQYDILRALAIFFVVIGHAIQARTDFDNNSIFKAIYIFHMPVFFYICGMVYGLKPLTLTWIQFGRGTVKRAEQLLLPFFAWYAVYYFIKEPSRTLTEHFLLLYKSADNGLWFFWVLFCINLLADLGKIIHARTKIPFWIIGLAGIYLFTSFTNFLNNHDLNRLSVGLIEWYLPFFLAGIYHRQLIAAFGKYEKLFGIVCSIAFPFMVHYWFRNFHIDSYSIINNMVNLPQNHIVYRVLARVYTLISVYIFILVDALIPYIYAAVGMMMFFMLAKRLYAANRYVEKAMVFIGQRTLEVYAIHFFFIGFIYFSSNTLIDVLISSIVAVSLALLISEYLIKPSPAASLLLLGRRS